MRGGTSRLLFAAVLAFSSLAYAGGSNYGVSPGVAQDFQGHVTEWSVPTPTFARDPAPAPDGSIFISVMNGNKVARFDPKTETFKEWDMPPGHHPHGVLADRQGMVWTTGHGDGTIGRLDPHTGEVTEYKTSSPETGPHTLVLSDDGKTIWFTMQTGNRIGRLDIASGKITEYASSGGPYGIAIDKAGNVWWCRMADDRLGRLEPATGKISELYMGRDSRPRRMAVSADGTLWVTLYGAGKLAKVDPAAQRMIKEYPLPGGDAGPYAVTVDGAGTVWVNEIRTDTVVRFDPKTERMQVIALPSKNVGIRKMAVDAAGHLWYMGSHNGRLGRID